MSAEQPRDVDDDWPFVWLRREGGSDLYRLDDVRPEDRFDSLTSYHCWTAKGVARTCFCGRAKS
jgi:hypothetical protein